MVPAPPHTTASLDAHLGRFVPPSLLRALARDPLSPPGETFDAAVLFADISGFSTLAAHMAEHGVAAAEELATQLNGCFGETLRLVHSFGGEVEKFAGDALLAVFRADEGESGPEGLQVATRRAAQCAREIARAIDGRLAGEVALGVHVGVGAGTLSTMHLALAAGDRAFVLVGEPIAQVAVAAELARPGEVCLSPVASSLASGASDAVQIVPRPLAMRAADAAHGAAPYLNPALRERLTAVGDATWIAELRRATVFFVRLGAIPVDPGADAAHIATLARIVGEQVLRFDGLLHDLLVDDKGLVAIVMFGVRMAHEDDAARGVRAAMELHAALVEAGARPSIGVATGRVYCGVIGDAHRSELAVVGDAMNLAGRLMSAAEGQVLCAPATVAEVGDQFLFEDVAGIKLKSRIAGFVARRPLGAIERPVPTAQGKDAAVFGRDREWFEIAGAIANHRTRQAIGVILLEGEAGIGKSALVNGACEAARAAGLQVLRASGSAIDQTAPYHALRAVAATLLGIDPGAAALQQVAQIERRLAALPDVAPFASLLGVVVPHAPPQSERMGTLDAQARAESIRAVLLALVSDIARAGPVMLVVEDAHWLDSVSWALVLRLVYRQLPVLVLVSARPVSGEVGASIDTLAQTPGAVHLRLGPLDANASAALVCAKLGVAALAPGVETLIRERAAGHPYFIEELTLALRDAGLLAVKGDTGVLASSSRGMTAVVIPDTLERVLTSRIDALDENQRMALKVASVLGREFSGEALHAVYPVPTDRNRLASCLAGLCKRELMADMGGDQFQFKHAITCDVGYSLLPFAQRRDLHRAVAQVMEIRHAADLTRQAPLLAHHWGHAGEPGKALAAAEEAGMQAINRYANREAVHFFREALRFDQSLGGRVAAPRAAHWQVCLGRAHFALGESAEARRNLEQVLTRLGCPTPGTRLFARLGLVHKILGMFFSKPVTGELPAKNGASVTAVEAYNLLATLSYFANDVEAVFFCDAHACAHAHQATPSIAVAVLYGSVANLAIFLKLHGASNRYRDAAQSVAAKVDNAVCTATVLQYTGHLAGCMGDLAAMDRDMHRASALFAQVGMGRLWEEVQLNLGNLYLMRGDMLRSIDAATALEHSGRTRNDAQTTGWAMLLQGFALSAQGKLRPALERLDAAEPQVTDRLVQASLYGIRALTHMRLGDSVAAQEEASRVLEIAEKTLSSSYTSLGGYTAALETLVLLRLAAPGDVHARARVNRMYRVLSRFAGMIPIARAQKAIWAGVLAALHGKTARARRALDTAVSVARKSAVREDEPAALRWRARIESGDARAATLERAAQMFDEIGRTFEAVEARAFATGGDAFGVTTPWEGSR